MIRQGTPAIFKVGLKEILFGTLWAPEAKSGASFGILYVILTSIVGTAMAILLGVPIGLLTAIFLAEVAPKKLANMVKPAVELLAGIPSVVYGLLGILLLNPGSISYPRQQGRQGTYMVMEINENNEVNVELKYAD